MSEHRRGTQWVDERARDKEGGRESEREQRRDRDRDKQGMAIALLRHACSNSR